jgi:hypothetical protein
MTWQRGRGERKCCFALFLPKRTVFLTKRAENLVKRIGHVLQTPPHP